MAAAASQNFGVRLALDGAQTVEEGLRRIQATAQQAGAAIGESGNATGRALTVIERGTQATSVALQRMGGDAAALTPILETTSGAVGRLVTALGSGAGLVGVLGGVAAAVTGAITLYQNWDTVTRGVGAAYDFLTGRVRVTTVEITRANALLLEFRRLSETGPEAQQRSAVADRVGALERAQAEEREASAQVERLRAQFVAAQQDPGNLRRTPGFSTFVPTEQTNEALRQRTEAQREALAGELRVASARLAAAREAIRLNQGAIAALGEATGTVINPRLDPMNDPNLPTPPEWQEPPSGGGGGAAARTAAAMKDLQDNAQGAKGATRDLAREVRDLENAGAAVGKALGGAFEDLVFKGEKFSDVVKNLERDLLQIGTRALVLKPLEDALSRVAGGLVNSGADAFSKGGIGGVLGSIFSSGGGAEMAGTGALKLLSDVPVLHDGGIVGAAGGPSRMVPASLFFDAPRFHGGGIIGPDERPVIAQVGERILNRQETAAYNGGGAGVVQFNFHGVKDKNAFRETETQLRAFAARALARSGRNR